MLDLQIFQALRSREFTRPGLGAELAQLKLLPMERRAAYLGWLEQVIDDAPAAVKLGALSALGGANGRPAFRVLLKAVDDPDPTVRRAAVACFAECATRQAARWVHLVFHPQAEVRRLALDALPEHKRSLALFLLPDPNVGRVVRGWLASDQRPRLPENALGLLLSLRRGGHVDPELAARLLGDLEPRRLLEYSGMGRRRAEPVADALVQAARQGAFGEDLLDDVFAIIFAAPPELCSALTARYTEALVRQPRELRTRAAAAALTAADDPSAGIALLLPLVPTAFGAAALEKKQRQAGARALLQLRQAPSLQGQTELESWLSELALDTEGNVDLQVLAGLLRLAEPGKAAKIVRNSVGWDNIVDAFLRDPIAGAPLLSPRCLPERQRQSLLDQLSQHATERFSELLALAAWALPTDQLALLDQLTRDQALEVAMTLIELEQAGKLSFNPKKQAALCRRLVPLLRPDAVGDMGGVQPGLVLSLDYVSLVRVAQTWLAVESPLDHALAHRLFGALTEQLDTAAFLAVAGTLPVEALERLLDVLPHCRGMSFGKELALAHQLATHEHVPVANWAQERLRATEARAPLPALAEARVRVLSEKLKTRLGSVAPDDLCAECEKLWGQRTVGLVEVLASRPEPDAPLVEVVVALLGATEPPNDVAREVERFGSEAPNFLQELEGLTVGKFAYTEELPLLLAGWLWRWERQAMRVGELGLAMPQGLQELLDLGAKLSFPPLRHSIWFAVARCLELWGARDKNRFWQAVADGRGLAQRAIQELDTDLGSAAANLLLALSRHRVPALHASIEHIRERLPDVSQEVAKKLGLLLDTRGFSFRTTGVRHHERSIGETEIMAVRISRSIPELVTACGAEAQTLVEEAILRLLELEGGQRALAQCLETPERLCHPGLVADSIPLWHDVGALERVEGYLNDARAEGELKFRISVAFAERGAPWALEVAYAAAIASSENTWFKLKDYERLSAVDSWLGVALKLIEAPHPHAYRRATAGLLEGSLGATHAQTLDAFCRFLLSGSERDASLRLRVAEWLASHGCELGFPLLLAQALEGSARAPLARITDPELFVAATRGVLMGGEALHAEQVMVDVLQRAPIAARDPSFQMLLQDAHDNDAAEQAVRAIDARRARAGKLRELAELFAWGFQTGLVLTGRHHRPHMTSDGAYGYVRRNDPRVYVTPLPLLRGDPGGRDVVQGLILHELGHHLYHSGPDNDRVWAKAERVKMHGLLNLVADEHLERNLRSLQPEWGDKLKRLAAYAFQHADKEIAVDMLLGVLGANTFNVLSQCQLQIGHNPKRVKVDSGELLRLLETHGHAFARFMRALRMGLGNRQTDPVVDRALKLFTPGFKKLEMPALLEIAYKLRDIFGDDAVLLDGFGGAETVDEGERAITEGQGSLGDADVQPEVERILDPRKLKGGRAGGGRRGGSGKLAINVSGIAHFDKLTEVERLVPDPNAQHALARDVARPARKLRQFFEELGIQRKPVTGRTTGTRLDKARLGRLVLLRDPRVLSARQPRFDTDLFLGILVDCSGSMEAADNIIKARRFAALVVEAAKGLSGIDVRVFGFTDHVIYDAGDAQRSATASLEAGGGNNDAGALLHLASVAKQSRRRAKLLVMVSDGLPTSCSTEALTTLVKHLEQREHMVLAQVAVRPLEEQCFTHYVRLDEGDTQSVVRRFGETIARLVSKALR